MKPSDDVTRRDRAARRRPAAVALACLLLLCPVAGAEPEEKARALQALATEREMLTAELDQYRKTLGILQTDGTPPEESSNPAVRKLASEVMRLKERLIVIAEQEVTLLQEQIIASRSREDAVAVAREEAREASAAAIESRPLREAQIGYARDREAENVERLHQLLENYHAEVQEAAVTLPTDEEIAARERAQREAEALARIPFSPGKVHLSGAEGSTALSNITQRLMDPRIPESRRDISPICVIKTRLFGTLVGSESRSLTPVGKHHYVARIRLQPGDSTLAIHDHLWEVQLPQHSNTRDFLVTLYRPPEGHPELHVVEVEDLLAEEQPYIPAWLPDELDISTRSG